MSSRLFGVGIAGPELTAAEREILGRHPPYGVILFRRNIESVAQLTSLIASVRGLGARYLLLDQEGGPVDRLRDLLAPAPSFRRASEKGLARRAGELAGRALATLGFDVDLAPVVDRAVPSAGALVLGQRCASEDAIEVLRAAGEFLNGLHSQGIGGCLKHFPGLGHARLDTHKALPTLERDAREEALDLAPFESLMERAIAVMVSHAAGPDGAPASLSPETSTGLLRDGLGFTGAAFSDDLEMGALDAFGSLPQRCVRAAESGCDLLLVCRQIETYPACVEAVERSVPVTRRAEAAHRLEAYAHHLARLRAPVRAAAATAATLAAEIRSFSDEIG